MRKLIKLLFWKQSLECSNKLDGHKSEDKLIKARVTTYNQLLKGEGRVRSNYQGKLQSLTSACFRSQQRTLGTGSQNERKWS